MLNAEELKRALHDRGLRMTPQRQMVLSAISNLRGHISAEQIYQRVAADFPDVNISTVYRTLEVLEELGVLAHTHFHDGVARYHRAAEAEHQHTVCRQCGVEEEVDLELLAPLAEALREGSGFEADLAHVALVGLCRRCASR